MKQELNTFVSQENFENQIDNVNPIPYINPLLKDNDEMDLINPQTSEPQPMNSPDTPVANGYSVTLNYNHPDKINGCDITNITPMNYYQEINQQINNKGLNNNKNDMDEVQGYVNEQENDYKFLPN